MKVIIVDDEPSVRSAISTLLNDKCPDISIIASVGSVEAGYEAISRETPHLLFLDVELTDGTGFDLLERIGQPDFRVIFVTGHQEYALDAIKVSALDYIMKPFDKEELLAAVEKARRAINVGEEILKLKALHENIRDGKVLKRIILRTADHLQLVSVSDIVRAEADSNYTMFMLSGGKRILVSRTLKEFEKLLSKSGMIRVHQSHLVNISYIDKLVKRDGGYLILKDGSEIPLSPNLRQSVLQALNENLYG